MKRKIFIPHTQGMVDYKGESTELFLNMKPVEGGFSGDYTGTSDELVWENYIEPTPPQKYLTRITPGQVMALLKDPSNPTKGSYAKIFRAAYPQGNKAEDDIALEFLEQARMPYSADGMIDVADIEPALTYFMSTTPPYIDQSDFDRVMQGWPV